MISIRRIQIGESELFRQMRLNALRESPSAFTSTYESALNRSSESWNEQADNTAEGSDRATFIAFSGDSPIGIAALYRDKERIDTGEILQVWVSPEHRGKGVALHLLHSVFQWARNNGFRTVLATITQGNARALRFYQKCGFKHMRETSLTGTENLLRKEIEVE